VLRSPPSLAPARKLQHAGSDSALDHIITPYTSPNFVTQRSFKRPRESPGADFETFKEEIKQLISGMMVSHEKELKIITPTLLQIKESNANIESSITFLAAQTDELKKQVDKLEADKKEDREHINLLEEKMEDLQRENRKRNLEIKNVPKLEKESRSDLLYSVID
jgi:chromosome segregation ATPase